jgi:uncharacterized RDD family membrane protein YckC
MSPDDFTSPAPADTAAVEYASFGRRLGAALLDSLVLIIGLTWLAGPRLLTLAALIIVLSAYFQFCEKRWGQTIGKNATGIRVLSLDGSELTWNQTAWRNLMRLVDLPLAMVAVDYVIVQQSPRRQRLGDRVAKTIVVRDRSAERAAAEQEARRKESRERTQTGPTAAEIFGDAATALGRHSGPEPEEKDGEPDG